MHYLLIRKKSLENKETPVFCEMASAKTNLAESVPFNIVNGAMLIAGTLLLQRLEMNPVLAMAVVMITNSVCGAIANFAFVWAKHRLRLRLCDRIGVPRDDHSIAVMESMEYQSF